MGKKITYERWINLYLPEGWSEREEMGYVLLEKEGWPGLVQLSFIEREDTKTAPETAAAILLEDTLEDRDVPFPRDAVKISSRGDTGIAMVDYTYRGEQPAHWRIWSIVDDSHALLAAYISHPDHDLPYLDEVSKIIGEIEFIKAPVS